MIRITALAIAAVFLVSAFSGCKEKAKSADASEATVASETDKAVIETKDNASSSAESAKAAESSSVSSDGKVSSKSASAQSTVSETVSADNTSEKKEIAAQDDTKSVSPAKSEGADSTAAAEWYKAGQTVVVYVKFGNIAMNGSPAKIGAYDYWLTYNDDVLDYVSAEETTKGDISVVNDQISGMVKIAHISALGFNDDYTGEKKPTYKVTFTVKKDAADLGLKGECPSLTAVSMDGKDTLTLINKKNPKDDYSEIEIKVE